MRIQPWPAALLTVLTVLLGVATAAEQTEPADKGEPRTSQRERRKPLAPDEPYLVVLGIAQDGGYPQAGCRRNCCTHAWQDAALRRVVTCVAVIDPITNQRWMFDATPNFPQQLRALDECEPPSSTPGITGIFLTHAHIGHYTGLVHLGREAIGALRVPVYAMPRMRVFLTKNGPWKQLVALHNIELRGMLADEAAKLNDRLTATPILVPHRDEYSETVGFQIQGPSASVLYIPDVDKWERWDYRIETLIAEVDVAYLDGTFFADGEIPGRSMTEIPHPFITESMKRFKSLPPAERAKIRFIHLNHTNPALRPDSPAHRQIKQAGFGVAEIGSRVGL